MNPMPSLRRALGAPTPPSPRATDLPAAATSRPRHSGDAAVLALLFDAAAAQPTFAVHAQRLHPTPWAPDAAPPALLLERRPAGGSVFAGHLGFPGGHIESTDAGPLAAALRETLEEIGLPATDIEILGHLCDLDSHLSRRVTAYVGRVDLSALSRLRPNPAEVAQVLLVPWTDLCLGARDPAWTPPVAVSGSDVAWVRCEHFEQRRTPLGLVMHYWHLAGADGPPATLWGLTGELVYRLLLAGGQTPQAVVRELHDWNGVQP